MPKTNKDSPQRRRVKPQSLRREMFYSAPSLAFSRVCGGERRLIKLATLLLLCFVSLVSPSSTIAETHRAPANVRAVWVRPFIGADESTRASEVRARAFIRRELEEIKQSNFNTVYVESFFDGYTIYPSRHVPQRPLRFDYGIARDNAKTWDALQVYIEEGRKLNLSVQAWFEVFFVWNTKLGTIEQSPIFGKHPEWLALDEQGSPLVRAEAEGANKEISKVFLSPSHPGARRFLVRLVEEIATNYPTLDGIQLDYIRYPAHTPGAAFDYNPDALAQFTRATKLDARKLSPETTPREWRRWQDWKTAQVTDAVGELTGAIRRLRPRYIISAAIFPGFEEDLRLKMQDTREWARRGYIDALLPMLYSTNFDRVAAWADEFRRGIDRKTRIYPALYVNHFYDPKTHAVDERYLALPGKHNFDGVGFFAAQLITPELRARLATRGFEPVKNTK